MSSFIKLIEQAEKAERLARQGFDAVTTTRLLDAAADYRRRASGATGMTG